MTTRIHRFDFGTLQDFRGPIAVKALDAQVEKDAPPPPPPPPVFNEQDIEAAKLAGRKQGFSEGFAAGQQEAKNQSDALLEQSNKAICELTHMVQAAQTRYQTILSEESKNLSQLVLTVARKIAGEAIDARGEKEAIAIVERCLPVIFSKPRLSIELNSALFDRALPHIEDLLRQNGYEGEVLFRANDTLGMSDINLDWGNGEIKRSSAELWQEIETLIARIPLELTFEETLNASQNTTGD